jgi:RNA polymerase sigma factor (sigma-70 family)
MPGTSSATLIRQLRRIASAGNSGLADRDLVRRWVESQDQAAFEVLLWRHGPTVLSVCRRVLREAQDVEDAFQATFLTFIRKAGSLREGAVVGSWLYRVAYRIAIRAAAGKRKHEKSARPISVEPDESLLWRDLRPVLDYEVDRLPRHYRDTFILCCVQGKTNQEAARELGRPLGTILSRLNGARRHLRERLTRRGIAPSAIGLSAQFSELAQRYPVSQQFVRDVLRVASPFATGQGTGLVSPRVLSLVKGVSRTMFYAKCKFGLLVGLGVCTIATGVGWGIRATASAPVSAASLSEEQEKGVKVGHPKGWWGGSGNPNAYQVGVDREVSKSGKASAYVQMQGADAKAFGTLAQAFQAKDYLGKRVRLSAYLKTENATGGAGLWMRVDGPGCTLAFDNMEKRMVQGTTKDWKKVEIVLDVPEKASAITIGLMVTGNGKAWVDDFQLERVGKDVASTNMLSGEIPANAEAMNLPATPVNLDFEDS